MKKIYVLAAFLAIIILIAGVNARFSLMIGTGYVDEPTMDGRPVVSFPPEEVLTINEKWERDAEINLQLGSKPDEFGKKVKTIALQYQCPFRASPPRHAIVLTW